MAFVGRQDELGSLRAEAEAVRRGQTRFVLISGEAGVGKSALAGRFAEQLSVEAFHTARTVCASAHGISSLRPWRLLLQPPAAPGSGDDAEDVTSIVDGLVAAATERPLLVVLDDLQRADATMLGPLNYLADLRPPVPLLLLGLLRDPPGSTMEISRPATHLVLRGLPPSEAGELITGILQRALPTRVVADLTRRCDGNPGLLAQVCRRMDPRRIPETGVDRLAIDWPPELRATAAAALEPLDESAREVLTAAAVIGREFDLGILERILPADIDPVRALDAARAHDVVTWRHGEVYAFRQVVVREVLYDSLGVVRRAELHEAVAEALGAFRQQVGDRSPTVAEFAHHLTAAAVLGGEQRLELAITYATAAGTAATVAGRHHDACVHYETALGLAVRAEWPPGPVGRLTVALGRAALAAGQIAVGRTALRTAARQARQAGDTELLAEVALGYGPRAAVGLTPPDTELVSLLTEAAAADLPAAHAVRVAARLAAEVAGDTRVPVAGPATDHDEAELLGPRPLAESVLARAIVTQDPADARAAVRAALRLDDPLLVCQARLALGGAALAAADLPTADSELEQAGRAAAATGQTLAAWWAAYSGGTLALVAGDLDRAEAAAVAAREVGRSLPDDLADLGYAAQLGAIRLAQGRRFDLAPLLADLNQGSSPPGWLLALSAHVALDRGDPRTAAAVFDEVLPDAGPWSAALLVDVAVALGDRARLAAVDEILAGCRTPWLVIGPPVTCAGPVALLRARVRAALGDPAGAEGLLSTAEPFMADTVWQPVARALRAELAGREPSAEKPDGAAAATAGAEVLTRREQEVLDLALAGHTAKEIAGLLFISERTAESHLASIYRKLNVRSRVELLARHLTRPAEPHA